ncbi:unnamed protein product [Phytophthora lilii]|uniref:Unnamed protein product n=1 Tax=Phytophthora lilii TaxID=2077276 RepID=A0A9W6TQR1_9STRA|nr:unnamed protein product [Phytophthora lilii]
MDLLAAENVDDALPPNQDIDERKDKGEDDQQAIVSLDAQLDELRSRILASSREDEPNDAQSDELSERNINERKKKEALRKELIEQREDALWVITELPTQVTTSGCAALELFQTKKWREILQLVSGHELNHL